MNIIVIGGGLAGLSAALPLARNGIEVTVLEADSSFGSMDGGSTVLHAGELVNDDLFGESFPDEAPLGPSISRRDQYYFDGQRLSGYQFNSPESFEHQYIIDPAEFNTWMAQQTDQAGATIRKNTVAGSLIWQNHRVVGAHTNRGPLHADAVFIAEGGIAELVDREGLERRPPSQPPSYSLSIRQQFDVSNEQLRQLFNLTSATEGTVLEWFIEPPGTGVEQSPIRSWLIPRKDSVSLGMFLDVTGNTHGDLSPKQAMTWLREQPFLDGMLEDANNQPVTASVRRSDRGRGPNLVDHGVAVGGAAAGLGQMVPVINSSGPAIRSGRLFARAISRLEEQNSSLDRSSLRSAYVSPLLGHRNERTNFVAESPTNESTSIGGSILSNALFPRRIARLVNESLLNSLDCSLFSLVGSVTEGNQPVTDDYPAKVTLIDRTVSTETDDREPNDGNELVQKIIAPVLHQLHLTDRGEPIQRLKSGLRRAFSTLTIVDWIRLLTRGAVRSIHRAIQSSGSSREHAIDGPPPDDPESDDIPESDEISAHPDHSFILYRPGYLASTTSDSRLPALCPPRVFEMSRETPPSVHPERCVGCGACRGQADELEWSGINTTRNPANPQEKLEQSVSPRNHGEWTTPGTEEISTSRRTRQLGRRFRVQLEAWSNRFQRMSHRVTPDDVSWMMTLARMSTSTFTFIEESLGEPTDSIDPLMDDIETQLQRIQHDIANRHMCWAHETVRQLLEHHLRMLDEAINLSDEFVFPYEAYHQREAHYDSSGNLAANSGSASEQAEQFVRQTLEQFPHRELFGEAPESVDPIRNIFSAGTLTLSEELNKLGQSAADSTLLQLSETEERMWQEAGRYNVIADLVEQWRQWAGELTQLADRDNPHHSAVRGRLLADLWATRDTINRVHAQLMTGHAALRSIELLRTWTWALEKRWAQAQFLLRNSHALTSIHRDGNRLELLSQPIKSAPENSSGPSDETMTATTWLTSPDCLPAYPHQTIDRETDLTHLPDQIIPTIRSFIQFRDRCASLTIDSDDPSPTIGELTLRHTSLDAMMTEWVFTTNEAGTSSKGTHTDLLLVMIDQFSSWRRDDILVPADLIPEWEIDVPELEASYQRVLGELIGDGNQSFKKSEPPSLPHDHLEPLYDSLRERVLSVGQQLKSDQVGSPDVRPLYRLVDSAAEFASILSLYRRLQALQDSDRTDSELLDFYREIVPLARRRSQGRMTHLGEKIDQIVDGIEHGITPPERRVETGQ